VELPPPGTRACRHRTGRGPGGTCGRKSLDGIDHRCRRPFFSAPTQRHDACLWVAEDAPNDGLGAETGKPVRVRKPHDFSHAEIMTGFHTQGNGKTHGKTAAKSSNFGAFDPHAWEKSHKKSPTCHNTAARSCLVPYGGRRPVTTLTTIPLGRSRPGTPST